MYVIGGKGRRKQTTRRPKHRWVDIIKMAIGDDRFYGLVIRVLGYRSGGTGSIPGTTKKK
jgi:hypothetical protein